MFMFSDHGEASHILKHSVSDETTMNVVLFRNIIAMGMCVNYSQNVPSATWLKELNAINLPLIA